jgi:sugar phosphate isomerase/epimerase
MNTIHRRTFLHRLTAAVPAAAILAPSALLAVKQKPKEIVWPIGCFNRPWFDKRKSDLDEALDGIKSAGYKLAGLLTRNAKEPLIGSDATPGYLAALKKKVADRGLTVNVAAIRNNAEQPLETQIKDLRRQIDNAKIIGTEFLLTFGSDKPEHYDDYYKLMKDAAAYSQERGMKLVLKPHGGASSASQEIALCIKEVDHPNFKIWFDAGNIIYYTDKNPVEQLKPIVEHVTGLCAKDCDGPKGEVFLEFGKGKVDFLGVFKVLKNAGFNGPLMVECCARGETAAEISANAAKNREYLERLFDSL